MLHPLVTERKNKAESSNSAMLAEHEQQNQTVNWSGRSFNRHDRNNLATIQQGYGNQGALQMLRAEKGQFSSMNQPQGGMLQRQCACGNDARAGGTCAACQEKQEMSLQRKVSGLVAKNEVPPIVHEVLNSPGQPLDRKTKVFMESRFKQDFSQVQIHKDLKAAHSARVVHSHAYTVGPHIVFGKGKYAPETISGQRLLAHELAHVVQQQSSSPSRSSLKMSHPMDTGEREADQVAEKVLAVDRGTVESATTSVQHQHLMRDFDSTLHLCHALLKSRVFQVNNGVVTAALYATRGPTATEDEGDAPNTCGSMPYYYITLTQKGIIYDSEISTHPIPFGYSTTRTWTGLTSGDYYFTIWTNNTNPYCCVDGTISVSTPSSGAVSSGGTPATLPSTACYDGDILYTNKGGSSHACPALTGTIGDPTPSGRYCLRRQGEAQVGGGLRGRLLQDRDRWFLLEPLFPTTRFRMQLHPGGMSSGCITVMDRSCFDQLALVLNAGSTTSETGYDGYPPGNASGTVNPPHAVDCVGILTVTPNFGGCRSSP
jgi:hypothetical protein